MPNLARAHDPITSHQAAASISDHIPSHEAMIYSVLVEFGPMTAEGIAECICGLFRWKPDSVAVVRRFKNMEGRFIRWTGTTWPNTNGRRARVMEAIK